MQDLIDRQAAIDAIVQCTNCGDEDTLREYVLKHSLDNGWTGGILEALDTVKDLPSTQPEVLACGNGELVVQPEPQWIPVSERLPSKEERKEWIDNNLDGIGYLYPCLVTRYSGINPDRTKNNPYVAKHYFDGEDFLNAGEEVCSEYVIAWMPLPEPYKVGRNE